MLKMSDLPFGVIGAPPVEYICKDEVLLDDSAFSAKETKVAKVGDVLKLSTHNNYGRAVHEVYGNFRY